MEKCRFEFSEKRGCQSARQNGGNSEKIADVGIHKAGKILPLKF